MPRAGRHIGRRVRISQVAISQPASPDGKYMHGVMRLTGKYEKKSRSTSCSSSAGMAPRSSLHTHAGISVVGRVKSQPAMPAAKTCTVSSRRGSPGRSGFGNHTSACPQTPRQASPPIPADAPPNAQEVGRHVAPRETRPVLPPPRPAVRCTAPRHPPEHHSERISVAYVRDGQGRQPTVGLAHPCGRLRGVILLQLMLHSCFGGVVASV